MSPDSQNVNPRDRNCNCLKQTLRTSYRAVDKSHGDGVNMDWICHSRSLNPSHFPFFFAMDYVMVIGQRGSQLAIVFPR